MLDKKTYDNEFPQLQSSCLFRGVKRKINTENKDQSQHISSKESNSVETKEKERAFIDKLKNNLPVIADKCGLSLHTTMTNIKLPQNENISFPVLDTPRKKIKDMTVDEKREYKINKTQIQREQQKISTSIIGSRPFYPFRHGRIWRNFCRGNCNGLRFFVFVD